MITHTGGDNDTGVFRWDFDEGTVVDLDTARLVAKAIINSMDELRGRRIVSVNLIKSEPIPWP